MRIVKSYKNGVLNFFIFMTKLNKLCVRTSWLNWFLSVFQLSPPVQPWRFPTVTPLTEFSPSRRPSNRRAPLLPSSDQQRHLLLHQTAPTMPTGCKVTLQLLLLHHLPTPSSRLSDSFSPFLPSLTLRTRSSHSLISFI